MLITPINHKILCLGDCVIAFLNLIHSVEPPLKILIHLIFKKLYHKLLVLRLCRELFRYVLVKGVMTEFYPNVFIIWQTIALCIFCEVDPAWIFTDIVALRIIH